MSSSSVARVLDGLGDAREWLEDFYRDLHAHPELSHEERRTAKNVAERLRASGCEVHEQVGGTGVVGLLGNGEGPVVLLRADMDALPVREATGLPYASTAVATTGGCVSPLVATSGAPTQSLEPQTSGPGQ